MQSSFQKKVGLNARIAAINIILVVNALVWYLCIFSFLKDNSTQNGLSGDSLVAIVGINLLVLVLSAFFSTQLIQKIESRLKFLIYWMAAGVFLSPLPLLINGASFSEVSIISAVIGLYFGLGMPILMGYYGATTETVNRGRVSGLAILFNGASFVLLSMLCNENPVLTALILSIWKLSGLLAILLLKPEEAKINKKEKVSYKKIVRTSSIMLYFVPWLMFSLVNNFAFPILYNNFTSEYVTLSTTVESVLAGLFAVFFGFFADTIGRKRLLLFGFALLGLGYATLGIFPDDPAGWWFYTCADGVAWGGFTTLFLLTLWGDLADKRDSEKFYVIGFLPYLISNFLQVSIGQYVTSSVTNLMAVFSFASFFLFAAVLPLYLAPETLPEKAMKDRNLKSYLEKAQKLAEKEANKSHRKEKTRSKKNEDAEPAEEENSKEYEEAKKLAEQYY
jgi:MFS family permease